MTVTFALATAMDDPGIRRLLRENPVPGAVAVSFEREPNYFLGCDVMGNTQTLVAHDERGEVVGMVVRAVQPRFVNGEVERVGYLGGLRITGSHRGSSVLARGARALHELHLADSDISSYFTTLVAGDERAARVLPRLRGRGLPTLKPIGELLTIALFLRRGRRPAVPVGLRIERGAVEAVADVVAFLDRHARSRQLAPALIKADFAAGSTRLRGFSIADLIIARRDGQIVGTLGLWDQSTYKQHVVHGLSGVLRWGRPAINVVARLANARPLPPVGGTIDYAFAAFACVASDDQIVFRALLDEVAATAADRDHAFLMLGLAADDPLLPALKRRPRITYRSTIYSAEWEDGTGLDGRLDGRPPYLEIATL